MKWTLALSESCVKLPLFLNGTAGPIYEPPTGNSPDGHSGPAGKSANGDEPQNQ